MGRRKGSSWGNLSRLLGTLLHQPIAFLFFHNLITAQVLLFRQHGQETAAFCFHITLINHVDVLASVLQISAQWAFLCHPHQILKTCLWFLLLLSASCFFSPLLLLLFRHTFFTPCTFLLHCSLTPVLSITQWQPSSH